MNVRMLRGREGSSFGAVVWVLVMANATISAGTERAKSPLAKGPENVVIDGMKLFLHEWKPKDPQSREGDGLGPQFNAKSCAACHNLGGMGGAGPVANNVQLLSVAPSIGAKLANAIHPGLKDQPVTVLHRSSTHNDYEAWRAKRLTLVPVNGRVLPSLNDPLEDNLANNQQDLLDQLPMPVDNPRKVSAVKPRLTERNTTALFGDGLIDQIPDEVIKAQITVSDDKQNNASAFANKIVDSFSPTKGRVVVLADGRVGKFGWKAQNATLADFTLTACAVEVGLEVPGHHQAADPRKPNLNAPGFDLNQADCDALVAFVAALPAPRRDTAKIMGTEIVAVGETIFGRIGCADCHRRTLGDVDGIYSDLLVHDMGQSTGDVGSYGSRAPILAQNEPNRQTTTVTPSEWRTPPLWGVADSAPYMHDGRATSLEDAIMAHQGQGAESAKRFRDLRDEEKSPMLRFLNALKAPFPEQLASALVSAEK